MAEVRTRTTPSSRSTENSGTSANGSTQTAWVGASSKTPPLLILTRTTSSRTRSIRISSPCVRPSSPVAVSSTLSTRSNRR